MGPIDYTGNAVDPSQSLMRGLQQGFGVQQIVEARQQAEAQRQQQLQMNMDLAEASRDPSKLPAVMAKYPALAEKVKHGYDAMTADQQREEVDLYAQAFSALNAGQPKVVIDMLRDRADAYRNGGDDHRAKATEALAQLVENHPDQAKTMAGGRLASLLGDKAKGVFDSIFGIAEAPARVRTAEAGATKAEADAQSAAVTAKFAESKAVSDLNLTDANIKHLAADTEIARQNSRIAAMQAATARANSETERKKLDLQIQEATQKRDDLARTKVAEVRQGAATLDNLLNTVEQIKKHPALDAVVGPLAGKEMYPHTVAGMSPAGLVGLVPDAGERADVMALIEQLQSQASLSQLQSLKQASANGASGFGALSAPELKIVQEGIQSLKRTQSPESYRAKLDELSRLMKKNRDILADKFGVDPGKPDTPAAPGSRPPLSSFGGG